MNSPDLGLVALLTHAREVPSEARESFGAAAARLAEDPRAIVLRTCHRVEIYAATDDAATDSWDGPPADVGGRSPLRLPPLPDGGRRLAGHDAARHLLTVAAGLDSIVIGEDQILHQLRSCLSERHLAGLDWPVEPSRTGDDAAAHEFPAGDPGPLGARAQNGVHLHPVIERLFQIALHVGRRTRTWREGPPRSLSDVALDRIEAATGRIDHRPVLVVGAGRMGRLAALTAARRRARVLVANRTHERAEALACDADGLAVDYGPSAPLPEVAAAVVAVGGRWDIGRAAATQLVERGTVVVDLSSPPALEPALRAALGDRYVSVDDLARGPYDEVHARFRHRVERLVDEADAEFGHWVAARTAVPAIQALTEHAETRRASEVERLLRRMPSLDERERELVDQMSRRLVAALLHAPLATLREDETGDRERAARELFGL